MQAELKQSQWATQGGACWSSGLLELRLGRQRSDLQATERGGVCRGRGLHRGCPGALEGWVLWGQRETSLGTRESKGLGERLSQQEKGVIPALTRKFQHSSTEDAVGSVLGSG